MSPKEKQLREKIREYIKQAPQDLDEGGLTGWVIDKIAGGMKWATNRKADYQYDFLLKHKDFKGLAKKFKMSDANWQRTAKGRLEQDPKGFAKVLRNNMSDSRLNNLFKKHGLR